MASFRDGQRRRFEGTGRLPNPTFHDEDGHQRRGSPLPCLSPGPGHHLVLWAIIFSTSAALPTNFPSTISFHRDQSRLRAAFPRRRAKMPQTFPLAFVALTQRTVQRRTLVIAAPLRTLAAIIHPGVTNALVLLKKRQFRALWPGAGQPRRSIPGVSWAANGDGGQYDGMPLATPTGILLAIEAARVHPGEFTSERARQQLPLVGHAVLSSTMASGWTQMSSAPSNRAIPLAGDG